MEAEMAKSHDSGIPSIVQEQALSMAASLRTELQWIIALAQIPDSFYWNDQYTRLIMKERKTVHFASHNV